MTASSCSVVALPSVGMPEIDWSCAQAPVAAASQASSKDFARMQRRLVKTRSNMILAALARQPDLPATFFQAGLAISREGVDALGTRHTFPIIR